MLEFITNGVEIFSNKEIFDEENYNEGNCDEE